MEDLIAEFNQKAIEIFFGIYHIKTSNFYFHNTQLFLKIF